MNLLDEAAKIILGITITGVVGSVIWLFKWCDRTDLKIHDSNRDVKHLQRNHQTLSDLVAKLDMEDEQISYSFRQDFISMDRRVGKVELQVHVIEVLMNGPGGGGKPQP